MSLSKISVGACTLGAVCLLAMTTSAGVSLPSSRATPADSGQIPSGEVGPGQIAPAEVEAARPLRIAPRDTQPFGKSYREWAAAWTEWAVQTKGSAHPLLDTTTDCSAGQRGRVWFLGGDFGGGGRRVGGGCTVPEGGGLFVALPPRVRP